MASLPVRLISKRARKVDADGCTTSGRPSVSRTRRIRLSPSAISVVDERCFPWLAVPVPPVLSNPARFENTSSSRFILTSTDWPSADERRRQSSGPGELTDIIVDTKREGSETQLVLHLVIPHSTLPHTCSIESAAKLGVGLGQDRIAQSVEEFQSTPTADRPVMSGRTSDAQRRVIQ